MKPRKAAVIFIFITVTLDMLALGLIAPVLPKLVLDFLGGDAPSAAKWFGIFGTVTWLGVCVNEGVECINARGG